MITFDSLMLMYYVMFAVQNLIRFRKWDPYHVGCNIMQIADFFHSFCSQYYTRFKSYCCEAYNIIRKSSNLILNLFHLMAGSNIPDIASDPEKGILKVTSFMVVILFMFFSLQTWVLLS